jgi:hypothetical protein
MEGRVLQQVVWSPRTSPKPDRVTHFVQNDGFHPVVRYSIHVVLVEHDAGCDRQEGRIAPEKTPRLSDAALWSVHFPDIHEDQKIVDGVGDGGLGIKPGQPPAPVIGQAVVRDILGDDPLPTHGRRFNSHLRGQPSGPPQIRKGEDS